MKATTASLGLSLLVTVCLSALPAAAQSRADSLAAGIEISDGSSIVTLRVVRTTHADQPGMTTYVRDSTGTYVPIVAAAGITIEVVSSHPAVEIEVRDETGSRLNGVPTTWNTRTGVFSFHLNATQANARLQLAVAGADPSSPSVSFVPAELREKPNA